MVHIMPKQHKSNISFIILIIYNVFQYVFIIILDKSYRYVVHSKKDRSEENKHVEKYQDTEANQSVEATEKARQILKEISFPFLLGEFK